MTDAEAETLLWALSEAKKVADEIFPRSAIVARIEILLDKVREQSNER
jgi:hypothetical protein